MDKGLTLKERSGVQETATNDIIAAIAAAAILFFIFNLIAYTFSFFPALVYLRNLH